MTPAESRDAVPSNVSSRNFLLLSLSLSLGFSKQHAYKGSRPVLNTATKCAAPCRVCCHRATKSRGASERAFRRLCRLRLQRRQRRRKPLILMKLLRLDGKRAKYIYETREKLREGERERKKEKKKVKAVLPELSKVSLGSLLAILPGVSSTAASVRPRRALSFSFTDPRK